MIRFWEDENMKRIPAFLLAVLLLFLPFISCAEQAVYRKEENTGRDKDNYPYIIRMPSAVWYLAKADIELLGEDAFYEGLYAVLDDMEADFADARAALEGYIPEEIPPVDIYTDFCNKAELSKTFGAYYRSQFNYMKVFGGWDNAFLLLLHEYVHYLTMHCAESPVRFVFWEEGIPEYIAFYVCKNRLARSYYRSFDFSAASSETLEQVWDKAEDCLNPRLVWIANAVCITRGYTIGTTYLATKNELIERTAEIQDNPKPEDLTYEEASGMVAYLVATYGKDTVLGNWDLDPEHMDTVYGKTFSELYREWADWNEAQCKLLGITVP